MINVAYKGNKYCVFGRAKVLADGSYEYSGFEVVELLTDQAIKSFETFQDARKFAKSLESGQAFDGWTPTFMVKNNFQLA